MKMDAIFRRNRTGLTAVAMVLLIGFSASSAVFAGDKKAAAPAPKAAAPKAAPAARPSGGAGASASHGATTSGSGKTTANPSGSSKITTSSAGGAKTTATTGGKTTATAGKTSTERGGGSTGKAGNEHLTAPAGTKPSSTAIKSPVPKGSADHVAKDGSAVRTRANGKVSDVHDAKRNMDIHHGLDGSRKVSVKRADGSKLVAERGRPGYVERGYHYGGREYVSRGYYYHGGYYNRYYGGYYYGGVYMNVYAPGYYYGPGFYGWAYNPWSAPISYGWGWGGSPWYGYYGGYFTPYSVYPSAAFWLTDYIISANLQAAYAARAAAAAEVAAASGQPAPAPLTPEVKQMISDEVKAQLALENSESGQNTQQQAADPQSSGVERLLTDGKPHVFVAGGSLDVTDASGAECAVSDGDALQLMASPPAGSTVVNLVVLASKGGAECKVSSTVAVQVSDLQEMQNHMRETIDDGLKELQAKQGKGGLPAAPPSAQTAPVQAQVAAGAPAPDPKDAADLQAQAQQADQAETEVAASAGVSASSPIGAVSGSASATTVSSGPAPSVSLGQTTDQVTAILGKPTKTADVGTKQIYYYDGMKVIFKGGKVTDVE